MWKGGRFVEIDVDVFDFVYIECVEDVVWRCFQLFIFGKWYDCDDGLVVFGDDDGIVDCGVFDNVWCVLKIVVGESLYSVLIFNVVMFRYCCRKQNC